MWIPIARVDEEIPEHGKALELGRGEHHAALFKVGGCLYATSNVCSHQFALLTEGSVEGEYVDCPMHQGRFHIPTGAAQCAPVTEPIETYAVRVVGHEIQIDFPRNIDERC